MINKNGSLEVDTKRLEGKLMEFIYSWENLVDQEVQFLKDFEIGEIFVDISPIGILVAEKLRKPINLVSNFTWYQQYQYLGLNDFILNRYLELDKKIENLYMYLLHLDFSYLTPAQKIETDFICRKIDLDRIEEIKREYGKSIFISCGKSVELGKIVVNNFGGTIFMTSGLEVENRDGEVIKLPLDILDTQNYIGASEFIISKAGWGTVAEAVCSDTPMVLIERDGVLEDSHIISEMKKIGGAVSIKIEEL